MSRKVLIMAGGTGGHIFPALAIAKELTNQGANIEWLGGRNSMEGSLVPKHGYQLHCVHTSGLRGKNLLTLLKAFFLLCLGLIETIFVFLRFRPDRVVGMGGYASGIGGMVAKIFFVPLIIHEQNAIPGTTNKLLGKFAQQSLQAFDNTFDLSINAVTVGNPILFTPEPKNTPELVNNLLVLGGSLGAQKINETITSIKTPLNIWHQTGVKHLESVKLAYQNNPNTNLCIESFIENMAEAYAWADVVVCRSGAMTVSELVATKTIAILVPFPYAVDNHQTKNAQYLSDQGAGILLEESLLNAETIDMQLRSLTTNKLKDMTSALESLQIPSPEKTIVDYILIPNRSKSS